MYIVHKYRKNPYESICNNPILSEQVDIFLNAYKEQNEDELKKSLVLVRVILMEQEEKNLFQDKDIELILQSGMLEHISNYISNEYENDTILQRECLQILQVLLMIEETSKINQIVNTGVVPKFFYYLNSQDLEMRDLAAGNISNIIGENSNFKQQVIEAGLIQQLNNAFQKYGKDAFTPNYLSFLLSNITDMSDFQLEYEQVEPLIPILSYLLNQDHITKNQNYTFDLMTAIKNIIDDREAETIGKFIIQYNGIVLKVIQILQQVRNKAYDVHAIRQAMNFLLNISIANDEELIQVIQFGLHDALYNYSSYQDKQVRDHTLRAVSNICQMSTEYLDILFDHHKILLEIYRVCECEEFQEKKQGFQALGHLYNGSEQNQIIELNKLGGIKLLSQGLDYFDYNIQREVLDGVKNLLEVGEQIKISKGLFTNSFAREFEQNYDGKQKLVKIAEYVIQNESGKKKRVQLSDIADQILFDYFEDEGGDQEQQEGEFQDVNQNLQNNQDEDDDFFGEGYEEYTEIDGMPMKEYLKKQQENLLK